MNCKALDVVCVSQVVPLNLLLDVVEDHNGRYEVHHLSRGQEEQVGPTVAAPIPVDPLQLEPLRWCTVDLHKAVVVELLARNVHHNGSTT